MSLPKPYWIATLIGLALEATAVLAFLFIDIACKLTALITTVGLLFLIGGFFIWLKEGKNETE